MEKAEKNDTEGKKIYKQLKKEYMEKYMPKPYAGPHGGFEIPGDIKKGYANDMN